MVINMDDKIRPPQKKQDVLARNKYNKQLKEVHKKAPPKPISCECCGKIPNKWACDHYPNTTKFRGWVCWECNNAAGSVGDSYEGAVKLFNYLYAKRV